MTTDKLVRGARASDRHVDEDRWPSDRRQWVAPGKRTLTSALRPSPMLQLLRALQLRVGDPATPGVDPGAPTPIRYEVVVNVVQLQPATDRITADFAAANQIYNQHGIRIRMGDREVIPAEQTRAILSRPRPPRDPSQPPDNQPAPQDGRLDEGAPPYSVLDDQGQWHQHRARASEEERELLSRNRSPDRPTAYWLPADTLPNDERTGMTYESGFFGNLAGNEGIAITADADREDFAHELWHLLARAGHEDCEGNQDSAMPPENLAYPHPVVSEGPRQGERRGTELNEAQIRRLLRSRYVRPVLSPEAAAAATQPTAQGPQRRATAGRDPLRDPTRARQAAASGVSGGGGPLPFADELQRAFGAHDLSMVRAHMGTDSVEACDDLGAEAYAFGADIAFRGIPTLHTAAHETAHVIQQRAGVDLSTGIGSVGDRYERHADEVADAVVRGDSVESMFDPITSGSHTASIQRQERSLADRIQERWDQTHDKGRIFDLLRQQQDGAGDQLAAVNTMIERIFAGQPDDIWLGQTLARYGPEPAWPDSAFDGRPAHVGNNDEPGNIRAELTNTQGASVEAFFFPGRTDERVLIISGTHGTEHSGVEVVQNLLGILRARTTRPRRTVIVIPELFSDNVDARQRPHSSGIDPNRNLPARGTSGLAADAPDAADAGFREAASRERSAATGDDVLPENLILITLIERFRPSRVVSVHGTQYTDNGGIYYDPQSGTATESERALCERMTRGVRDSRPIREFADSHPAYDRSHAVAGGPTGIDQSGANSPRPYQWTASGGGTSFGNWGSRAVSDSDHASSERAAMSVITVEPPGVPVGRRRPRRMSDAQAANRDSDDLEAAGRAEAAAQREAENMAFAEVIEQFIIDPSDEEARRQAAEAAASGSP